MNFSFNEWRKFKYDVPWGSILEYLPFNITFLIDTEMHLLYYATAILISEISTYRKSLKHRRKSGKTSSIIFDEF